jgi:hypothetical protein
VSQPSWWRVPRWAEVVRPAASGYHHLIVEYRTTGATLTIELPFTESSCGDLDERLVDLEILDEYLSMSRGEGDPTGTADRERPTGVGRGPLLGTHHHRHAGVCRRC